MKQQDLPALTWLNGKTHPQSNGGRRNASGRGPEHQEAIVENASRLFAIEVGKAQALTLESETKDVLVIQ